MAQISHAPILQPVITTDYVNFNDFLMSNSLRPKPHKALYLGREGGRSSVTVVCLDYQHFMLLVVRVRR
jgi:hypothetical protein